jgi:GNAT superfamily N-acetyltransferase
MSRARVEPIPEGALQIVPASPERFDDVTLVLGGGDARSCLCQYWRLSSGAFGRSTMDERRQGLRRQLGETPPAGMLAYLDGEPVGWCGFATRQRAERLVRSRTIPAIDDLPVWAVYCFTVRVGYRRRGIALALLGGLIDYARREGAPALEGYPADLDGARIQTAAAYVGTVRMFEEAGFHRVLETDARSDHRPRWLMRLDLREPPVP